jgi:hypothetical protein
MVESVDFEVSADKPATPGAAGAASPGPAVETLPPPPAVLAPAPVHWLRQRLVDLARLMRLDRPIGI